MSKMKKKYITPRFLVTIIEIEDSYCNASSTLRPSDRGEEIVSEYEIVPDDERTFFWQ